MRISFHGAAREVTGSCHLLEIGKKTKILVDCGLFQGSKFVENKNQDEFNFDPSSINYLLLTHAHLDHFGRLPFLVKKGFQGEIISTPPSKDLSEMAMLDSAKFNEKRNKWGENNDSVPPYNTIDVINVLNHFGRQATYEKPISLSRNVKATYFDAGHIIGSASVFLEIKEKGEIKTITFSGDIGNNEKPIVTDPTLPPKSDFVVMESTYGDRNHKPFIESTEEFYNAISETFKRGGNVVNSVFAIERSQEILYLLREGLEQKKIPRSSKVFLDSPMAIKATKIIKNFPEYFDGEAKELIEAGKDPFSFPNLILTESVDESKSIRDTKHGAVILAGSGMAIGGRVIYHLQDNLPRPESSIIISGFVPEGSLLKKLIDGEKVVKILGKDVEVKAKIYTIGGFSAHAGQDELIQWQKSAGRPTKTFLVHGDEKPMQSLAKRLRARGNSVKMPELYEGFEV